MVNVFNELIVCEADPRFPKGEGAPTPEVGAIFFAEHCMKMKEFRPRGGAFLVPPPPHHSLDPPMPWSVHCKCTLMPRHFHFKIRIFRLSL